jgi:DNA-binding transcriptional regulator YiaG
MPVKKMGAPLKFPPPSGDPLRDKIIALRRGLNLSQEALGAKLGLSKQEVNMWEAGTRKPSGPALKLLEQLAKKTLDSDPGN